MVRLKMYALVCLILWLPQAMVVRILTIKGIASESGVSRAQRKELASGDCRNLQVIGQWRTCNPRFASRSPCKLHLK